ncbi:MAG: PTS fructose transporter subunit IIA [Woeseiaceae bacterium]
MVNLLIVTHNNVGGALFDAAISVLGHCPLPYEILPVSQNCDPQERYEKALAYTKSVKENEGILVLTDMYGSTPSNIATKLESENTKIVTGLNLPMLLRVMNYPTLTLENLVDKAISGGKTGVSLAQNNDFKRKIS